MTAEGSGGFAFLGAGIVGHAIESHRAAVDALAHEAIVEGARAVGRVDAAEVLGDARFARDGDAIAALLPQQVLEQPLDVALVDGDVVAVVRQDGGAKDGDAAIAAFQCDGQRIGPADVRESAVGAVPERGRQELRVEHRTKLRRDGNDGGHLECEGGFYHQAGIGGLILCAHVAWHRRWHRRLARASGG